MCLNPFVLVAYASVAVSRPLLQWLLTCLNFTLDLDLFCWYRWKKWFLWTSCWKLSGSMRFDLILMIRDIYINSNLNPLTKFTSSSKSTMFKDNLQWNMSQMIRKTILISTRIVISYVMKQCIVFWVYWKADRNWDNNMVRISQWRGSQCRTNTSIRRNK